MLTTDLVNLYNRNIFKNISVHLYLSIWKMSYYAQSISIYGRFKVQCPVSILSHSCGFCFRRLGIVFHTTMVLIDWLYPLSSNKIYSLIKWRWSIVQTFLGRILRKLLRWGGGGSLETIGHPRTLKTISLLHNFLFKNPKFLLFYCFPFVFDLKFWFQALGTKDKIKP